MSIIKKFLKALYKLKGTERDVAFEELEAEGLSKKEIVCNIEKAVKKRMLCTLNQNDIYIYKKIRLNEKGKYYAENCDEIFSNDDA